MTQPVDGGGAEQATIYFGDEASVRSDYHCTTWAPRGKTPVVTTTGARFKVNLISAISTRGALHFMATEKNFTAEVFCEFLRRLIDNATHPVYLIVDRHSVHRSAEVQKFVASTEGKRVSRFRPRSPFFIPTPFPACKAVFKSSNLSPSAPLTLRKRQPPF